MCSLFLKAIFLTFILLHCSSCQYRVTAIERLPVLHHSEGYISFLWDHWVYFVIFENGVLLMYTLEGVNSVAHFITAYEESQ